MPGPTGTITYLFTDIEGSTRLVQQLGAGYGRVLEDHDTLLRTAFERNSGHEVDHEGDAFFVVFPTVRDAVRAAVEAQMALDEHDWGDAGSLEVRMGLHTGEASLAGDRYIGIHVHRTARIAGAAHGGQVILSGATRALLDQTSTDSTSLVDLGEHRLKDLEDREHLYQLSIAGLRSEFPSLRSLENRPNNLPVQLTPFVARQQQVRSVEELLESNRLVTLTGPGGTGKTRLSLEVAANCLERFSDGVYFVPLAPVFDPEIVPSMIAHEMGISGGAQPIAVVLKQHLSQKHMLLVLDNFEQVLPAASFVSELLSGAPRVCSLISSRAALRIAGEQEFPVPAMELPDPHAGVDEISRYAAIELFLQRARAIKPDFSLTEGNAPVIAAICARLDGLPLAIELAAARLRTLSPQELLTRLEACLSILSRGPRDLPSRQQTLRGAIEWSYDLLDEDHRMFFRRIGVFAGGATLEAIEAICTEGCNVEALDGLDLLVEHSLIRRVDDDSTTRFRFLQTIREFALDVLSTSEEYDDVRRRHAEYFGELAEAAQPHLTATDDWLDRISDDLDNFRTALRCTIDKKQSPVGLGMASALWRAWHLRGHLEEGRRWFEELLAAPESQDRTAVRAQALMGAGSITYWQNDFEATRSFYSEGLEIFRELNDEVGVAQALYNLGFIGLIDRDPESAKAMFLESKAIHDRLGDRASSLWTSWGLSMAALQEMDLETAGRLATEVRDGFIALGDWYGEWTGQYVTYQVERRAGNYEKARRMMLESTDTFVMRKDTTAIASLLELVGEMELQLGRPRRGLRLAALSAAIKKRYGGEAPPALLDTFDPRELAAERLGPAEIESAWQEGERMTQEEGIAYMLEEPEDE